MALALRGPADDDSESDANDSRSFVNHGDGSDGGRSVDVNAMNQALALSAEQMALQAQSPGGDASGTGKLFANLCPISLLIHSEIHRKDMCLSLVSPDFHCIFISETTHGQTLYRS
jgi:hypothetical protein